MERAQAPASPPSVPRGTNLSPPPPSSREILLQGLDFLGLDPALADPLDRLAGLLFDWARRINLTGHRSAEAIAERLILDAMALGAALPDFESLADLGSGAGFPGLPLAIAWRERSFTLVEPRERRHHFQRRAIRELGLENVTLVRGRAEEPPTRLHGLAVAQAMAPPPAVARMLRPWTEPGGFLVIPGVQELSSIAESPDFEAPEVLRFPAPGPLGERTAWIARRPV